jgi:hypothetical protein
MRNKVLLSIMTAVVAPAWGQEGQMTARDMFYSWGAFMGQAKPPAVKKRAPPAKPVEQAKQQRPPSSQVPTPPPREPRQEPQVVLASLDQAPLGLRYSILKEAPGGTVEVDTDSVFRSGDRIRLTVMANDRAYLYIIQRGSSGNWGVLFPSAEINGGNNVVEREKLYEIPAGHWFAFDEQPGKERVFLVLSRKPEPNLEKMMYQLQDKTAPKAKEEPAKVLLAQDRPINDALVERVRAQVYARDLVFEKVDDKSAAGPAKKQEKAVYVVNKTGSAESRVVADLTLNHQ